MPLVLCRRDFTARSVRTQPVHRITSTTTAVKKSVLISVLTLDHQPSQHSPTIQWSGIPGNQNQLQQMAQQHLPSQHQIAPYQFPSSAASPSLWQVSCSSMHLQPSTSPRSQLRHVHHLLEPTRSVHSNLTSRFTPNN